MKDATETSLVKHRRIRPMGSAASMCVDGAKMANTTALRLAQKLMEPLTQVEYAQTVAALLNEIHKTQEELLTIPLAAREDLQKEADRLGKTAPLDASKLRK